MTCSRTSARTAISWRCAHLISPICTSIRWATPGTKKASGPDIAFHTTFPSPGSYRLYLDFQHRGVVRTAAFSVNIGGEAAQTPPPGGGQTGHHH